MGDEDTAPPREKASDGHASDGGTSSEPTAPRARPRKRGRKAKGRRRKKKRRRPPAGGGKAPGEARSPTKSSAPSEAARDAPDETPAAEVDPAGAPAVAPRTAWLLASVTGLLCPLAFVGFDVWPLAFVSWVPLLVALRGRSPRQAALMGWWAGFAMTMIGFHWLISMLEEFSGFPIYACVFFASVLCLQKGGRIALFGWLYARAATRGWHAGAVALGAFAVSELVYPLLFPWYFGAAFHELPILMQTADLGGPVLVSLVALATNVAVAELLQRPVFDLEPDRRTVALLSVPAVALVYGAWRMHDVEASMAATPTVRVGMIQGASPLRGRHAALPVHLEMNRQLAAQEPDLVVWSESAASRAFPDQNYELAVKQAIGRHLGVPSIVGFIAYERVRTPEPTGRRTRLFNRAAIVDTHGNVKGHYDKQFLLMFGEYLPLGETFPVLYEWSPNSGDFSPGESFAPLPFGEHRIATMICYEDIMPAFVSELVDAGNPDLLVNMTNDTWFGDTIEPLQHLALAKFRSVEHRLYMVRVTNTGVSAIIDAVGRTPVTIGVDLDTPKAAVGDVRFLQLATVYKKLGNIPWWILTAIMGLAAFVRRRS